MASNTEKDPSGFPFLLVGVVMFVVISCLPLLARVVQIFTS